MNFILLLLPFVLCLVVGKKAPKDKEQVSNNISSQIAPNVVQNPPHLNDDNDGTEVVTKLTSKFYPFSSQNVYVVHQIIDSGISSFQFDEKVVDGFVGSYFFENFEDANLYYVSVQHFDSFIVRADLPATARVLKPGEFATMDIRPGRITINLDDTSKIIKIRFF